MADYYPFLNSTQTALSRTQSAVASSKLGILLGGVTIGSTLADSWRLATPDRGSGILSSKSLLQPLPSPQTVVALAPSFVEYDSKHREVGPPHARSIATALWS